MAVSLLDMQYVLCNLYDLLWLLSVDYGIEKFFKKKQNIPNGFMWTIKHFCKRQDGHQLRLVLSIGQAFVDALFGFLFICGKKCVNLSTKKKLSN